MELLLHLLRARSNQTKEAPELRLKAMLIETLALANSHDVISAIADGIKNLDDPAWIDLLPFVSPATRNTESANYQYVRSAQLVSKALSDASIPHVFLKGLAFFIDDPSSLAWRTVSDIDLLLNEADLRDATNVIQSLGYRQSRPSATYSGRLHHHAAPLLDESTGVFYELHTRLMQVACHNPFTFKEILAESRVIQHDCLELRVPSPEHRMFHLIAHAQISNWGYAMRQIAIKSLLDAAELGRRHDVDWQAVARSFGLIRGEPEFMGFLLAAHRLMGLVTGFEAKADAAAMRWTDESIAALHSPTSRALNTARVLRQYLKMAWQDPQRLELIWHACTIPSRRKQMVESLGIRLGFRVS
jgi:hypothetical protein